MGARASKENKQDWKGRRKMEEKETWPLLSLATSGVHRMRGLLCTGPGKDALMLVPCCDIHTVGMRHALDVAFVDRHGCIVESHRRVGPSRRLRNSNAVAVVERFADCGPWFRTGDRVGLSCVRLSDETVGESSPA